MRKLLVGGAVIAVTVYTVRRIGSTLGERAMRECETMFASMPDEFPPKRMMRGIDEIRQQNARILRLLEQQEQRHAAIAAD